jgi:hypothetical protein
MKPSKQLSLLLHKIIKRLDILASYSHSAITAVIPIPVVVLTSGIEVAAATQSSVFV